MGMFLILPMSLSEKSLTPVTIHGQAPIIKHPYYPSKV